MHTVPLSRLAAGSKAAVSQLLTDGPMRRRLLDLGLVAGTPVECLMTGPGGSLSAYSIRGAVIAIRRRDAENILVETL